MLQDLTTQPTQSVPPVQRLSLGRAKERLIDWLSGDAIADRQLIPSERNLADLLGLGRGTLRRAIKEIEADGLVIREGKRLLNAPRRKQKAWLSNSIALLLPSVDLELQSKWTRYVTMGVSDAVRAAGFHAITLNMDRLSDRDIDPLIESRPLGVLLPEHFSSVEIADRALMAFTQAGIPVVAYGGEQSLQSYDRVYSDQEEVTYRITLELLQQGRRPVRIWSQPWTTWWLEQRSRGYERAFAERGLTAPPIAVWPHLRTPSTKKEEFDYSAKQLIGFLMPLVQGADRADALMVTSDRDTFYAAAALRMLGLEPGKDVVITGYDNYWEQCEERAFSTDRPFITVDKNNKQTGQKMLELLTARIEKRLPEGAVAVRAEPEICRPGI